MKLAMGAVRFFSVACVFAAVAGINTGAKTGLKVPASFVRAMQYKYTLRVCNAYPFPSALDVYMQNGALKLSAQPMAYKTCADFEPTINVGDRVEFKVGDTSAGTFTISDLPVNDAVLLIVIYRHDTYTSAVAFESHVFSNVGTAQVAVLDVFKGTQTSELRVQRKDAPAEAGDDGFPANATNSELLRFDSVVAVDPGMYDLLLRNRADGQARHHADFVALPKQSYVAIRCGVNAEDGNDFPEDLIVFPHSDPAALGRGPRLHPSALVTMALLALALISSSAHAAQ